MVLVSRGILDHMFVFLTCKFHRFSSYLGHAGTVVGHDSQARTASYVQFSLFTLTAADRPTGSSE